MVRPKESRSAHWQSDALERSAVRNLAPHLVARVRKSRAIERATLRKSPAEKNRLTNVRPRESTLAAFMRICVYIRRLRATPWPRSLQPNALPRSTIKTAVGPADDCIRASLLPTRLLRCCFVVVVVLEILKATKIATKRSIH